MARVTGRKRGRGRGRGRGKGKGKGKGGEEREAEQQKLAARSVYAYSSLSSAKTGLTFAPAVGDLRESSSLKSRWTAMC
jgi:hypothetical protein